MEKIYKIRKIKKINIKSNEDVYDITVKKNHNFFANKLLVHNCSEIGMPPYSSCILQLLNLTSFVDNPFTDSATFDEEKFKRMINVASRLTDDIVDIEIEKIEKIIEKIKSDPESEAVKATELNLWNEILKKHKVGRRTGLGFTGLGDMLAMLGISYNSQEAIEFVKNMMFIFNENIMIAQTVLAKERGTFEVWDWEKEKNDVYISRCSGHTQELVKKYGRRNISMTCVAPAGTVSILTQTTSGIEPVYQISYNRKRKLTQEELNNGIKPDEIDNDGVSWTIKEIQHPGFLKWKETTKKQKIEDSPYFGCQAEELDWKFRVQMQSVIQNGISHSISSTINLHKDTPPETISDIYLYAWKMGLKGITVYRDGCRSGVLTKQGTNIDNIIEAMAPKRPITLECDIHYRIVNKEKWVFFVSKLNDIPYDIFGGKRDNVEIPKKYNTGWIIKNGKKYNRRTYDLCLGSLDDENERILIKDIAKSFSPDAGSYTRLISMMLRHGIPIRFICEQLLKIDPDSEMYSFEKGISRVLKTYISDGEKATGTCDECGSTLIYSGGCVQCSNCSWSKC